MCIMVKADNRPSYLIKYQKQGQMITKWTTREKPRQTEQNQNDVCNEQGNILIQENESLEEGDEEKITIPPLQQ